MIKELNDKDKILKLQNILNEFLNNFDCSNMCRGCKYDEICGAMYKLDRVIWKYKRINNITEEEE